MINLGVGGFGTLQELLVLEQEGLRFDPDLVILAFYFGNDVANNSKFFQLLKYRRDHLKVASRLSSIRAEHRSGASILQTSRARPRGSRRRSERGRRARGGSAPRSQSSTLRRASNRAEAVQAEAGIVETPSPGRNQVRRALRIRRGVADDRTNSLSDPASRRGAGCRPVCLHGSGATR